MINPGCTGMPSGRPGGAWALLKDGQVSVRHTPIDVQAAIEAVVTGSSHPQARAWARDYLTAQASDAQALSAFAPRDGRGEASTTHD